MSREYTYTARQDSMLEVLVEAIERGDTERGHGRRLAEEACELLSACPPVIKAVVERIIAADGSGTLYGDNSGWCLFAYAKERMTDLGEARKKLAEALGAARNRDLEEQAAACLEGAKQAADQLRKEQDANRKLCEDLGNAKQREENLLVELLRLRTLLNRADLQGAAERADRIYDSISADQLARLTSWIATQG